MSTFYLVVQGKGEGCNYTLKCNKDFVKLKAQNWKDATAEAQSYVVEHGFEEMEHLAERHINRRRDESKIDTVRILEVVLDEAFDIDKWLEPFKLAARKKDQELDRASKEAQFEALKKELGK
jgi:hypothetical protein